MIRNKKKSGQGAMQNTNTVSQAMNSAATHKINGRELPYEKGCRKAIGEI